jgi:cholesterol transport system auxiliary component
MTLPAVSSAISLPGAHATFRAASPDAAAAGGPSGAGAGRTRATLGLAVLLALGGCGALPDRPARAVLYDFGPGTATVAATASANANANANAATQPAIALAEIESGMRLEGTQVLYRLGYADANELRPYAQARWSVTPVQLLHHRLRDALASSRTVLTTADSATLARTQGQRPHTLRVSLEEFTQYFETPTASAGLVRLRATLVQSTPAGERVLAQRSFTVRQPAPSADAAGGVKALAAASDAAIGELVAWVDAAR